MLLNFARFCTCMHTHWSSSRTKLTSGSLEASARLIPNFCRTRMTTDCTIFFLSHQSLDSCEQWPEPQLFSSFAGAQERHAVQWTRMGTGAATYCRLRSQFKCQIVCCFSCLKCWRIIAMWMDWWCVLARLTTAQHFKTSRRVLTTERSFTTSTCVRPIKTRSLLDPIDLPCCYGLFFSWLSVCFFFRDSNKWFYCSILRLF